MSSVVPDPALNDWVPMWNLGGQQKVTVGQYNSGPPANPADKDIWVATDVYQANTGIRWAFMYNAGSTSTYKWEFIGGIPAVVSGGTASPSPINTYFNILASVFTAQRAGDYLIEGAGQLVTGGGVAANYTVGPYVNTVGNNIATYTMSIPASSYGVWVFAPTLYTVSTAGWTIGMNGAVGQVGATFSGPVMTVLPRRLS